MARNKRLRAVIIAGCALVVVAAVGVGVAFASPSGRPRYVTAVARTGDVTQTYTTSGTIARTNTATASFAVDGTVSSVSAAVGKSVEAGDVLAVLKKGPLQLAVLQAETSVAQAKASLYSAEHPSSASTRSSSSASASASSASASSAPATTTKASAGVTKASTGVTIDPATLLAITRQISDAVAAESKACQPVLGASPTTPTPAPTRSASATPSATATASPTPTATATASPTATPSASATPSPAATVKDQADVIERNDPTAAELKACGEARAKVQIATRTLQQTVQRLVASGSRPSGSTGSSRSTTASSSTVKVSAAQVASAKAKLLQAEQDLQGAQDDLADAELVAPISGTVGSVTLAAGASASGGSVTVVGEGNARLTFELPLKTRTLVKTGQKVTVAPAGSATTLHGTITAISATETSGTAGDTPTYSTTVTVSDPDALLASGARASVSIPVTTATAVVRVPVSAVTPTGTGAGTVQLVTEARAENATTTPVTTGAVGGGWIEITSGVKAGDLVVLADNTAALPTNSNGRRTTTSTTRAMASPSATGQPTQPTGQAQPTPAPTR
ncbi:MAG: HlyD family efflux transporter periplasmic adaptor subunit [Micropruina sp.]|uniref:efflux RND transporter periplasmic adaptor subunit n=1 Tax=Micropruina sp. TaxID=2737536 RepID=UPI0039E30048